MSAHRWSSNLSIPIDIRNYVAKNKQKTKKKSERPLRGGPRWGRSRLPFGMLIRRLNIIRVRARLTCHLACSVSCMYTDCCCYCRRRLHIIDERAPLSRRVREGVRRQSVSVGCRCSCNNSKMAVVRCRRFSAIWVNCFGGKVEENVGGCMF